MRDRNYARDLLEMLQMGCRPLLFPEEKALLVAALGQNSSCLHLTVVIQWLYPWVAGANWELISPTSAAHPPAHLTQYKPAVLCGYKNDPYSPCQGIKSNAERSQLTPQHSQKCNGTMVATTVNTAQQNSPLFI